MDNKSSSKIDAFELNLKQIQQTNEILHSIENKLNDVFSNQTPKYKKKLNFLQIENSQNQNFCLQDPEFLPTNPSFNNDNQKYFNNTDFEAGIQNENLKTYDFPMEYNNFNDKNDDIGYHSSIRPLEDYSANKRSLYSVDLKTKEDLDNELKKLQKRLLLLERENNLKNEEIKTSRQKILLLESSLSLMKNNNFEEKNNFFEKNESKFIQTNTKEDYLIQKLDILESKVRELSEDNKLLLMEKNKLISTIHILEKENRDNQRAFRNMELSKLEYESKLGELNKNHVENNKRIIEQFKNEINNLNKELDNLSKEKEEFITKQRNLEKERNKLNTSYSNLLNLHNQMLQIDIIKNEKNLQNSFSENNMNIQNNNSNNSDYSHSKKILENLETYKNEIEKLKNNSIASDNYFKDLLVLKEEIEKQKKENNSLTQEINKMKLERKSESEAERIVKMEEYIKKLESAYKSIENKYSEQLMINQEIKTNWKELEEKNKHSYDKIEKIYKKFFDEENAENFQKITFPSEKTIFQSCPISTKNIPPIENKVKSTNSLMKTKKMGNKENKVVRKSNSLKRNNLNIVKKK